jgi:hypothetical protein
MDDVDGDLTASVVVSGAVNTLILGTYTVTYSVKNSQQLTTSMVRHYHVVDSTAPGIKLIGPSVVFVAADGTYTDMGAEATGMNVFYY